MMVQNKNKRLLLITILLMMILAACNEPVDVAVEEPETPVAVAKAYIGSLSGTSDFTGTTKASSDIQVIPKSAGELTQVHVSVGDTVQAGQVIATIENRDQQVALQTDQTRLAQAQNALQRAKNAEKQYENNYEVAKINLEQAERQLEDAQRNFERMQVLFEEGFISQKELEEVEMGVYNLENAVIQAEINLQNVEASKTDITVGIKDAEVAVEQANLAIQASQNRIDDTLIKAPASGVIASIEAKKGEMVSNAAPFARIVSVDMIDVDIKVTAEQLLLFNNGDKVAVEIESLTEEYEGTVKEIAPAADQTGLFTVTVQINNADKKIKPGMIATILVEEVLTAESVIVPTAAVLERLDQTFVYVVIDGIAYQKEVEVIRYDTEFTAIKGEVKPDEVVITKGQTLINDGDKVRIVEEES